MANIKQVLSRPLQTQDLLDRLKQCSTGEEQALRALAQCMITVFRDDPKPSYVPEAAAISVVKNLPLAELVTAFSNLIIQGTADGNIKEPQILNAFTYVLWHTTEVSTTLKLRAVLESLATRLKPARSHTETETQYELLCCLSAVLDAMVEIRVTGIGRETVHEPLLKALKELRKSEELRLAQVATYAYEALRHIPDDEGPWHAVWRYAQHATMLASKTAGAVTTMDPSKLIDAVPNLVALLQGLQTLIEDIPDILQGVLVSVEAPENVYSKPKNWYRTLRYTDLLLRCKAWTKFQEVVQALPSNDQEEFLCGVYAQLELSWVVADQFGDELAKDRVAELFRWMRKATRLKDPLVIGWANNVCNTIGEPPIETKTSRFSFRHKEHHSSLKLFVTNGMPAKISSSVLLDQAWRNCAEAKVFYADAMIRKFYSEGKRLDIVRLSGVKLPMESCYINLAIMTGRSKETKKSFSLEERLKVDFDSANGLSLQDFFEPRKLADGKLIQPQRLYIQGRAGVGKTTLCKKIVYEHLHGMWSDKFDRILWLPLRKLKSTKTYNLKDLIHAEYFSTRVETEDIAECLARKLAEPLYLEKTLFLLDGLDEIYEDWETDSLEHRFLRELLGKSYVITTSRPRSTDELNFDLELETMGFMPDQVKAYLNRCVDNSKVKAIKSFIGNKPILQGLVRIPTQLDALCFCWEGLNFSIETKPTTMTTLYETVSRQLWRNDYHRWGKQTEQKTRKLTNSEITKRVELEENFIAWLAFDALRDSITDFSAKYLDRFSNYAEKLGLVLSDSFQETLDKISFLRAGEDLQAIGVLSYHFLHLTYQEFFAAKYFVRKWLKQDKIYYPSDSITTQGSISPTEFILSQRYSQKYNIFWRFVTGLIQIEDNGSDGHLAQFFKELDINPDLFGREYHQSLMYCLNEVAASDKPSHVNMREDKETRLKRWTLLDLRISGFLSVFDFEYPYNIVRELFTETAFHEEMMSRSLFRTISHAQARDLFSICPSKHSRIQFLVEYNSDCTAMSSDILAFWITQATLLLEDPDLAAREKFRYRRPDTDGGPPWCYSVMIKWLSNEDYNARTFAALMLSHQPKTQRQAYFELYHQGVHDGDNRFHSCTDVDQAALTVLWDCATNNEFQDISDAIRGLLKLQSPFWSEKIHTLSFQKNPDARRFLLRGLRPDSFPNNNDSCLDIVLQLATDEDIRVRETVCSLLGEYFSFFQQTGHRLEQITATAKRLADDSSSYVRESISRYFKFQNNGPLEVMSKPPKQLEDPNPKMRLSAARDGIHRGIWVEQSVGTLTQLVVDAVANIRISAASDLFLFNRSEVALQALTKQISQRARNSRESVNKYAVRAIQTFVKDGHTALPEQVITPLTDCLTFDDTKKDAMFALCMHENTPQVAFLTYLRNLPKKNELSFFYNENRILAKMLTEQGFYDCWPYLSRNDLRLLCVRLIRYRIGQLVCSLENDKISIVHRGRTHVVPFDDTQRHLFLEVLLEIKEDTNLDKLEDDSS